MEVTSEDSRTLQRIREAVDSIKDAATQLEEQKINEVVYTERIIQARNVLESIRMDLQSSFEQAQAHKCKLSKQLHDIEESSDGNPSSSQDFSHDIELSLHKEDDIQSTRRNWLTFLSTILQTLDPHLERTISHLIVQTEEAIKDSSEAVFVQTEDQGEDVNTFVAVPDVSTTLRAAEREARRQRRMERRQQAANAKAAAALAAEQVQKEKEEAQALAQARFEEQAQQRKREQAEAEALGQIVAQIASLTQNLAATQLHLAQQAQKSSKRYTPPRDESEEETETEEEETESEEEEEEQKPEQEDKSQPQVDSVAPSAPASAVPPARSLAEEARRAANAAELAAVTALVRARHRQLDRDAQRRKEAEAERAQKEKALQASRARSRRAAARRAAALRGSSARDAAGQQSTPPPMSAAQPAPSPSIFDLPSPFTAAAGAERGFRRTDEDFPVLSTLNTMALARLLDEIAPQRSPAKPAKAPATPARKRAAAKGTPAAAPAATPSPTRSAAFARASVTATAPPRPRQPPELSAAAQPLEFASTYAAVVQASPLSSLHKTLARLRNEHHTPTLPPVSDAAGSTPAALVGSARASEGSANTAEAEGKKDTASESTPGEDLPFLHHHSVSGITFSPAPASAHHSASVLGSSRPVSYALSPTPTRTAARRPQAPPVAPASASPPSPLASPLAPRAGAVLQTEEHLPAPPVPAPSRQQRAAQTARERLRQAELERAAAGHPLPGLSRLNSLLAGLAAHSPSGGRARPTDSSAQASRTQTLGLTTSRIPVVTEVAPFSPPLKKEGKSELSLTELKNLSNSFTLIRRYADLNPRNTPTTPPLLLSEAPDTAPLPLLLEGSMGRSPLVSQT